MIFVSKVTLRELGVFLVVVYNVYRRSLLMILMMVVTIQMDSILDLSIGHCISPVKTGLNS